MHPAEHSIILFDGVCNLCNGFVNLVIDNDKPGRFQFASLQSEAAQKLLLGKDIKTDIDSIILIEGGKIFTQSSAALRIAKGMNGAWKLLYAFIMVPPFIRNAVYKFIAANRYKWFGKRDSCRLPEPGIKQRFLE